MENKDLIIFEHRIFVCVCVSYNYTIALNFLPSVILSEMAYQNSCQLLI